MIKPILFDIQKTGRLLTICQGQLKNPDLPARQKKALIEQSKHLEKKIMDLCQKVKKIAIQPVCLVTLKTDKGPKDILLPGFTESDVKIYLDILNKTHSIEILQIKRLQ